MRHQSAKALFLCGLLLAGSSAVAQAPLPNPAAPEAVAPPAQLSPTPAPAAPIAAAEPAPAAPVEAAETANTEPPPLKFEDLEGKFEATLDEESYLRKQLQIAELRAALEAALAKLPPEYQ